MNIHNELEELVGKWCDRRAYALLREVLKVFPQVNPLTDGKHQLYEGLRKIEGAMRSHMTEEEDKKLEKILDEMNRALFPD